MTRPWASFALILAGLGEFACSDSTTSQRNGAQGEAGARGAEEGGTSVYAETSELAVPVPEMGRVYVKLDGPSIVVPSADPARSSDWDLAFEGYGIYTNSGPSGSGKGAAFGQLDIFALLDDTAPTVPFLSPDKASGALGDWYAYDGASHAIYSRFHVYGVQNAERLWKLQILSYYSELDNAPVSALYQVRYAELGDGVAGTQALQIDGTAGGLSGAADAPSGCLDLASGQVLKLAPADARASSDWDLCFRRDSISVNGEAGGPRGVGAFDLQAADTSNELLADVQQRTAPSTASQFDGIAASDFAGATFRGDHVVSAFETGAWVVSDSSPRRPARSSWLVTDASGAHQFLVAFSAFQDPTAAAPGTVMMHVKALAP